jgi:hypothetical protein
MSHTRRPTCFTYTFEAIKLQLSPGTEDNPLVHTGMLAQLERATMDQCKEHVTELWSVFVLKPCMRLYALATAWNDNSEHASVTLGHELVLDMWPVLLRLLEESLIVAKNAWKKV